MKTKFILIAGFLFLSACISIATPTPKNAGANIALPTQSSKSIPLASNTAVSKPTPAGTPTPDEYLQAKIILLYAQATDTQIAIQKTEQANRDAQATQLFWDGLILAEKTQNAIGTQNAISTQAIGTQAAASGATETQSYYNQITATRLMATQMVESDELQSKRMNILLWQKILPLIALLAIAGALFLALRFAHLKMDAKHLQETKVAPDPNGKFPLIEKPMHDPNLMHRSAPVDDLTAEQALVNKNHERQLDGIRVIASSSAAARILRPPKDTQNTTGDMPPISMPNKLLPLYPLPDWSLMDSWDVNAGIPYGVSQRGLMAVDINKFPHIGVFGRTGSGKSRYLLRPFITGAIAAGHYVIILGKMADFSVFSNKPNVKTIPIRSMTEADEAQHYSDVLHNIIIEMNRRDEYLTSHHISTWEQAGRPNTILALDELGNTMDMMPRDIAQEFYRWVQALVKEGRKVGFNVVLASQRAVGFKSIVEQLGRAVFTLADADASRYAIGFPGAEDLQDGYFLSRFREVVRCGSFDPTDGQIETFLTRHTPEPLEPITWIEGTARDVAETSNAPKVDDNKSNIIKLYLEYISRGEPPNWSEIERVIYGQNRGGSFYNGLKKAVADFEGVTIDKLPELLGSKISPTTTEKIAGLHPLAE